MSKRISETQRMSYFIAILVGMIPYTVLLYIHDWNPTSIFLGVFSIELSIITGIVMRFMSGLGIALTFTSFCIFIFGILAPSLKGQKLRARGVYSFVLITTMVVAFYAFYKMSAIFFSMQTTGFELLLVVLGVWSLVVLVYVIPLMKDEYRPELEQSRATKVQEKASEWKFSIWKGYRTRISKDYGRVYEGEFQRYGARLAHIRLILSGLLLLPIALVLVTITPLAAVIAILSIRMFSIDHKHFSRLERGLLILSTLSVGLLTTITFFQSELIGFGVFFDVAYGIGILSGTILLFLIML
jgi:MFS family permease